MRSTRHRLALAGAAALLLATGGSAAIAASQGHPSPAATPGCTSAQILIRGGREGGGSFGFAGAYVEFTNIGSSPCRLSGAPKAVTLSGVDRKPLPLHYAVSRRATLHAMTLAPGSKWSAMLTLSWQNWCGKTVEPLRVGVQVPGQHEVVGSFDGPPAYDFTPGCLNRHDPSRLAVVDAYSRP